MIIWHVMLMQLCPCYIAQSLDKFRRLYCSPVWHSYLINDILRLEANERHATNYILSNQSQHYKSCLKPLAILLLMMQLELNDITFCEIISKSRSSNFNVMEYLNFLSSHN